MAEALRARAHLYSIVVVGPMNPRLHHPHWYRVIGAITQDEFNEAAASPNTVCVPPFAGFQAAGISVACQNDRWDISTKSLAARPRLATIAKIVFQKLFETPIAALGINTNLDLETPIPDVAKCLSGLLASLDIGLPADTVAKPTCGLHYHNSYDSHSETVHVAPSTVAKDLVYVGYNTEYATKDLVKPDQPYFDFADIVDPHFDTDLVSANNRAQQIVEQLSKRCGA